ncbi:hypothetical protein Q8A67_001197 [Cirrhinus molitorella]|uniref:Uncharacterized protein n=1 Tax=Cirrhinus molitorella TaxID=172907 RepID=A0AA88TYH5_9TELE|nr:hypothetical protein Q8A67_001197 [Cirrhinus molitorella]
MRCARCETFSSLLDPLLSLASAFRFEEERSTVESLLQLVRVVGVSSTSESVTSRCSADLFREGQECCDIKRFSAGADPGPGSDAAGVTLITARPLGHSEIRMMNKPPAQELRMKMRSALNLLSLVCLCAAQKKWTQDTSELDHRDKPNSKSCSNLTQVLDNWKYAIMYQVKDMLVNDHASILPEYVRIQPLSDAVGDLYKQFNTLKDNLAKLTNKFDKSMDLCFEISKTGSCRHALCLAVEMFIQLTVKVQACSLNH